MTVTTSHTTDAPHVRNPLVPCTSCNAVSKPQGDGSLTMTHSKSCEYIEACDVSDVVIDLTELIAYHGGVCTEFTPTEGMDGWIVYFSPLLEQRLRLGRCVRFHTAAEGRVILKALEALPL